MGHPDSNDLYIRPNGLPERTGAGGVVVRVERELVLVALVKEFAIPGDYYVLPKGGVEPGESIEEAARREIAEEAGITDVTWLAALGSRSHQTFERRYWQTSHFGLYATRQSRAVIRDTEHHYDFGWFPIGALPPMFWRTEREIIKSRKEDIIRLALAWARGGGTAPP